MSMQPLTRIRLNIGDTDTPPDLTDEVIDCTYTEYVDDGKAETLAIWYTTIQCLEWLKAKYAKYSMRTRERVGNVDVDSYGAERYKGICELLSYYKSTPPNIALGSSILGGFSFADGAPRMKVDWRDCCLPDTTDDNCELLP